MRNFHHVRAATHAGFRHPPHADRHREPGSGIEPGTPARPVRAALAAKPGRPAISHSALRYPAVRGSADNDPRPL
ncbi:MAG: hypothetical protein QMD04_11830 [Anaerolineales bacterium]|nr:hypothetical protein [Anaerolineales bacterium]